MRKEKHTFYNYQFKHTAVSVSNHPDIQTQSVAEALNIHPFMLSRWKKELRDGIMVDNDKEARSVNELNDAKKKIKTLEKEQKRLREENTVLKKAERIFPGKK
jgi:transposase